MIYAQKNLNYGNTNVISAKTLYVLQPAKLAMDLSKKIVLLVNKHSNYIKVNV